MKLRCLILGHKYTEIGFMIWQKSLPHFKHGEEQIIVGRKCERCGGLKIKLPNEEGVAYPLMFEKKTIIK